MKKKQFNSEAIVTATLIDAIVTFCDVLEGRDLFNDDTKEAIDKLRSNEIMQSLMGITKP